MFGLLAGPSPEKELTSFTALASVRSASLSFVAVARLRSYVASREVCTKSQMWYRPISLNDLKPWSST